MADWPAKSSFLLMEIGAASQMGCSLLVPTPASTRAVHSLVAVMAGRGVSQRSTHRRIICYTVNMRMCITLHARIVLCYKLQRSTAHCARFSL